MYLRPAHYNPAIGGRLEIPGWQEVRDRWSGARVVAPLPSGLGGRNTLLRLDLGDRTAILKMSNAGTAGVERAALGRLGGRIAPRLFAEGPGWLLMEDLDGETPVADASWLVALGAAVGRVHADTAGLAWPQPPVEIDHAAFRWRRALQALPAGLAAAGAALRGGAARQLLAVVRVLEKPGALRVLSHGDLCAANTRWVGGALRILDWEAAGPRHAGFDRYPSTARWLRAQAGAWSDGDDEAFLAGWSTTFPAGAAARRGQAAAAVAWAAVAAHHLPTRLRRDATVGGLGHRERIVRAFSGAARRAREDFPSLAGHLCHASLQLGETWGISDDR